MITDNTPLKTTELINSLYDQLAELHLIVMQQSRRIAALTEHAGEETEKPRRAL